MASGHSTLWRLKSLVTLLAVVTAQLRPSFGCENAAVCQISCCAAEPSCQQAEKITCSCPDTEQLDLRAGDIPDTVRTISISGLSSLTVGGDALYHLLSLNSFSLHGIGNVFLEKRSLNLHQDTSLRSFKANGIGFLHIDSHALTGHWKDTLVVLKNVNTMEVADRGFSFETSGLEPSFELKSITALDLASYAFNASIRQLELDDVQMPECRWGTFNEKIDTMELNHVSIRKVKTRCFHYEGKFGTSLGRMINMKASTLDVVRSQGFSGNITYLSLQNTKIGFIHKHGFQANVKEFRMTHCDIGTLSSKSLSLSASHILSITNVNVGHLQKNALVGARIIPASHSRAVNFDRVEVEHAEPGSLALPRCQLTDVSKLLIHTGGVERCPTEKWTRGLVGADDHRPLYTAEFKVFLSQSEIGHHPCEEMEETMPIIVNEDEECPTSDAQGKPKNGTRTKSDVGDALKRANETDELRPDEAKDRNDEGITEPQEGSVSGGWIAFFLLLTVVSIVVGRWWWQRRRANQN